MFLMKSEQSSLIITIFLIFILVPQSLASKPHVVNFRSLNLYPEGLTWDPSTQHFIVGSLRHRSIVAVSDAGVVETLISDPSLPENVTILGLTIDSVNNRLLAVIHAVEPLPEFNALAAYDLRSRQRLFLSLLHPTSTGSTTTRQIANDVAVDFKGNAYVTNSIGNYVWKVNIDGEASIFSQSSVFTAYPVDRDSPYSSCGLNGIAYISKGKGYLLVVQSNTGKMFKVDEEDGSASLVLLNEDLTLPDGIAIRSSDVVVLVVSPNKLRFLKSHDSWGEGGVYDQIDLHREGFPTSVVVGAEDRVYVLYGHVEEGIMGNVGRERFKIEEVRSEKESEGENVWVFLFVGLGLAYFLFWRFQMRQLVRNMDKKTD